MLFSTREIETVEEKATRVSAAVPKNRTGRDAPCPGCFFKLCAAERVPHSHLFAQGIPVGPRITEMLADETVHRLNAAVRYLHNESHLTLEFLRFRTLKATWSQR